MLFDTIKIDTEHYGKVIAARTEQHNSEIASKVIKSDYKQKLSFEEWKQHVSDSLTILPKIIKSSTHLLNTLQTEISSYRGNSTAILKTRTEKTIPSKYQKNESASVLDSILTSFL